MGRSTNQLERICNRKLAKKTTIELMYAINNVNSLGSFDLILFEFQFALRKRLL